RPLYQPPIIHILSLKTTDMARSLCFHGALSVTSFQVFPSAELHTSRGAALNESNQPPKIHRRAFWTSPPLESRASQLAFSVTRTQSGALSWVRAGPVARIETIKSACDRRMVQIPNC